MNLVEFQQLSKRTAPFNAAPQNNQEFINILGNYSMGLVGEWFEYQQALNESEKPVTKEQRNHVYKELGDVLHYAVNLLTLMGKELDKRKFLGSITHEKIEEALGNILEIPKKHIYHGHSIDKNKFVESIYTVISYIAQAFQFSLEEILQMNIDKLKTRYPESFNVEDSIARKDVQA